MSQSTLLLKMDHKEDHKKEPMDQVANQGSTVVHHTGTPAATIRATEATRSAVVATIKEIKDKTMDKLK